MTIILVVELVAARLRAKIAGLGGGAGGARRLSSSSSSLLVSAGMQVGEGGGGGGGEGAKPKKNVGVGMPWARWRITHCVRFFTGGATK